MENYTHLAAVYDMFMDDAMYDEWIGYLEMIWEKNGARPTLVLELACGTGRITLRLWQKGYDVIALDISEDMLAVAMAGASEQNADILFLNQDMCDFELYGTVDSIVCLCDGMNYILEEDELLQIFRLAHNYLNPGGLLIFDMNTEHKLKDTLGCGSFGQTLENCAYICENEYDQDEMINEYRTNLFIKDEMGKYERYEEYHYQKAYTIDAVIKNLELSGLQDITVFEKPERDHAGNITLHPVRSGSDRIYYTAKKR